MTDETTHDERPQDHADHAAEPLELDSTLCTVDSLLTERESPLGRHFARLVAQDESDDE